MRAETRALIKAARALSEQHRIELYEIMLDSLDPADPAIDRLWTQEAADRMAAYRRGEIAAPKKSRYRKAQLSPVRLLEAAKIEFDEAIDGYNAQSPRLGDTLLIDILDVVGRISDFPEAWVSIGEGLRRCRPNRLPYGLIYALDNGDIFVVALAHLHRRPDSWRDRLGQ